MSQLAMKKFRELITFYPNPGREGGRIGESMAKEIGKHFLNISLVFLGGVFVQSALKEDRRIALAGLGFSVFFTCLGAAILKKGEEKDNA